MKAILKSIFVCFLLQTLMLGLGNSSAAAQALYTNPDTIQKYLKDRITDVKEQLKATRTQLKEEERTLRTLNRDLEKSRTQAQRDKMKLKEAKRNGKYYEVKPYIPEELQGDVEAKIKAAKEAKAAKQREIKQKEADKKDGLSLKISNMRSERQKEVNKLNHPNTTSYFKAQASINGLQSQLNELQSLASNDYRRNRIPSLRSQINSQKSLLAKEKSNWNMKVHGRISYLDAEIAQLEESYKDANEKYERTGKEKERVDSTSISYQTKAEESLNKTDERFRKGNNFTLYYAVLAHAIYKTHKVTRERQDTNGKTVSYETEEYVNKDFLFLLWFIRAIFFVIELLPSIVKIVSKAGQYELRVYHQEEELRKYLHSQDYKDYCYKMLHGDHQLEIDLQKQRHDAEKQVQQDIIHSIIAAEESVAKNSIDNWEKAEKGKMQVQYCI